MEPVKTLILSFSVHYPLLSSSFPLSWCIPVFTPLFFTIIIGSKCILLLINSKFLLPHYLSPKVSTNSQWNSYLFTSQGSSKAGPWIRKPRLTPQIYSFLVWARGCHFASLNLSFQTYKMGITTLPSVKVILDSKCTL